MLQVWVLSQVAAWGGLSWKAMSDSLSVGSFSQLQRKLLQLVFTYAGHFWWWWWWWFYSANTVLTDSLGPLSGFLPVSRRFSSWQPVWFIPVVLILCSEGSSLTSQLEVPAASVSALIPYPIYHLSHPLRSGLREMPWDCLPYHHCIPSPQGLTEEAFSECVELMSWVNSHKMC